MARWGKAVFVPTEKGLYDLQVDGRTKEYDVEPWDFEGAVRRARIDPSTVQVEDDLGYRIPLRRG